MKVQIVFQNLEKSEFVEQIVHERVESVLSKFSNVEDSEATVYVSKEHSSDHSGPNLFRVKFLWRGIKSKPLVLVKASQNLYEATAQVIESLLENINRHSQKATTLRRSSQRQLKRMMHSPGF
jgi:ribosome-associated translation inhibitor RaiA